MFFDNFPVTYFKLSDTSNVVVTDFIRAVKLDESLKANELIYTQYDVQDGETPEIISHKFYKSTEYHWVIMLINEKFDPWNDFPQPDSVIVKTATEAYNNINAVHHYVNESGDIVDEFYTNKIPVTNIEHERQVNDSKRSIKVLNKQFLSEFVSEYRKLIEQ